MARLGFPMNANDFWEVIQFGVFVGSSQVSVPISKDRVENCQGDDFIFVVSWQTDWIYESGYSGGVDRFAAGAFHHQASGSAVGTGFKGEL